MAHSPMIWPIRKRLANTWRRRTQSPRSNINNHGETTQNWSQSCGGCAIPIKFQADADLDGRIVRGLRAKGDVFNAGWREPDRPEVHFAEPLALGSGGGHEQGRIRHSRAEPGRNSQARLIRMAIPCIDLGHLPIDAHLAQSRPKGTPCRLADDSEGFGSSTFVDPSRRFYPN
jgi:hypothetical protein